MLREPRELLPRVKERLTVCAEAARNAARGILENWYDYETKATQVIFEVEKVMAEARAAAPAEAGAVP